MNTLTNTEKALEKTNEDLANLSELMTFLENDSNNLSEKRRALIQQIRVNDARIQENLLRISEINKELDGNHSLQWWNK